MVNEDGIFGKQLVSGIRWQLIPGDLEFAVRYTKGEEKVCELD